MNQTKRTMPTRTPGAVVPPPVQAGDTELDTDPRMPDGEPDAEGDAAELEALVADTSGVQVVLSQDPPVVTQPADIKAYIDQQIAMGVQNALNARAAANRPATAAELPDQSTIDPKAITREVLTKQGYVMPASMGKVPDHLRNLQA